ncbi:MAG: hypothetical protein OZ918_07035 [Nitrospirales bacterium]|nr:hypothetical protein [Nitrospirales bacterium]
MDEQRQGRHVEGQPFGFARPIQEGLTEALEFRRGGFGFFERLGVEDFLDERLALLTGWIRGVPIERGRERRIVAVGLGRFLLLELRLRADLRPHEAFGPGVFVGNRLIGFS